MKNILHLSLYLIIALSACHKEVLPPITLISPTDTLATKLNILWQQPLVPDTSNHTCNPQFILNENIVYSADFPGTIQMRDGISGDLKWTFNNFIYFIDAFWCYGTVMALHGQIVVHYWHRAYGVDAQSGQRLWASDVSGDGQGGMPFGGVVGDYLYSAHYTGPKPKNTSESLARHHYAGGGWDTLLTFKAQGDHYHPHIIAPNLWIDPQGDSILIVRNYEVYSAPPSPPNGRLNRMGLHAFNLRTRTFDWQERDFDPEGVGSQGDAFIDGNRLYLNTVSKLLCVDLISGQKIWEKQFAETIIFSTVVVHQNLVIVQSDQRGMWGIDKNSGAEVWYQPETDGRVDELTYFDGVVYCTSTGYGRLYAVRASDGKLIWAERSPNRSNPRTQDASFSYSTVVVDPERRVLYVGDHYYMMCIKVPE